MLYHTVSTPNYFSYAVIQLLNSNLIFIHYSDLLYNGGLTLHLQHTVERVNLCFVIVKTLLRGLPYYL